MRVAAPARTAKAANVAVARVQGEKHGDKVGAAASKDAPAPADKNVSHVPAKDAAKPVVKDAGKPALKPVATADLDAPASPPPAAKPPVAKAASVPQAMKIATAAPGTGASDPGDGHPATAAAPRQAAAASPAPGAAQGPTGSHAGSHIDRRPGAIDRIPPRAPSKAEIFVEGDYVVYPTHGVGKVERIAIEEIAGHRLELIHITFEENRMTLRVPVAKARSAGLRKLATRKLFDEAMAVLKGRARIKRTMWSRRAQEYEAKINSGDPLAIAEVVRDLHRNAGQPDQSFSERQIYEAAMDRLAAELAALDKTDKPSAVTKLADFLKTV